MNTTDHTTSLLAAVNDLAPQVRALSDQIESQRRLPQARVDTMPNAGLFRVLIPHTLGGLEVDVTTLIRVIEAIAALDGSVGWSTMIGATGGLTSGYLKPAAAQDIYGSDPNVITAGAIAPRGKAVPVENGYRITGRWPFIAKPPNS